MVKPSLPKMPLLYGAMRQGQLMFRLLA